MQKNIFMNVYLRTIYFAWNMPFPDIINISTFVHAKDSKFHELKKTRFLFCQLMYKKTWNFYFYFVLFHLINDAPLYLHADILPLIFKLDSLGPSSKLLTSFVKWYLIFRCIVCKTTVTVIVTGKKNAILLRAFFFSETYLL